MKKGLSLTSFSHFFFVVREETQIFLQHINRVIKKYKKKPNKQTKQQQQQQQQKQQHNYSVIRMLHGHSAIFVVPYLKFGIEIQSNKYNK